MCPVCYTFLERPPSEPSVARFAPSLTFQPLFPAVAWPGPPPCGILGPPQRGIWACQANGRRSRQNGRRGLRYGTSVRASASQRRGCATGSPGANKKRPKVWADTVVSPYDVRSTPAIQTNVGGIRPVTGVPGSVSCSRTALGWVNTSREGCVLGKKGRGSQKRDPRYELQMFYNSSGRTTVAE